MDMNGHASPFTQMQAMQQFEQFVQSAMQQALGMLAPGYKPTVIFSLKGRPDRDIIITAAGLDDVFKALASKMQANGLALPQQAATVPASEAQAPDLHLAVINVVSAIRRAMPFITGPGSETAKKMLLDAIKSDGVSETARQVVAGYLSSVPGMQDVHPAYIDNLLGAAENERGMLAMTLDPMPGSVTQ
jgi:hypothetical protein